MLTFALLRWLECMLINHALSTQITTEKLEELKGHIPRAGPKYRLGMYFETIHGVSDFEDVYAPSEDGYTSYWETDTEVDTDLGNLIFNNMTGDSASVICIDEAVDILALRERRLQEQALRQERATRAAQEREEHVLERSIESKRSLASRQSRRSHTSGSDGMYDEPPPLPPRRIGACTDAMATNVEEHTYESLDDFQEEYKLRVDAATYSTKDERGSGSPSSKDECDSDHSSGKGRTRSPLLNFTKARSNSTPNPITDVSQIRHRRKVSDPLQMADISQKRKRSDKVSPKGVYPPPVKGYSIPLGIPEEYVDYMTIPSEKRLQPTQPTSPNRQAPERRLSENRKSSKVQRSPSLIIKHKGQVFTIPVVDKKLQQRLEKVKGPPKTSPLYATITKPSKTLTRSTSDPYSKNSSGRHVSPPKETLEHYKTKSSKRHSQPSTASPSKQVTHYGML